MDGKQVKNSSNPTGTGKYLDERGVYVEVPDSILKHNGTTFSTNAIQTLTQAEYDAIPVKNSNTLYFII